MLTAKLVAMQQTTMHHYTKEDIQEKTALKMDFINKASSSLSDLLEPFRISSDKGRLLYNSDGLQIWDVIKQHKERGENLKEIRDAIATMVQTDSQTNDSATDPQQTKSQSTPGDGIDIRFVVDVLKDSFETAMNEKDRTILILEQGRGERIREISDRREEVVNLKTELEVKKINRAREAKQRADLMTELETLPVFGRGKKRKGFGIRSAILTQKPVGPPLALQL